MFVLSYNWPWDYLHSSEEDQVNEGTLIGNLYLLIGLCHMQHTVYEEIAIGKHNKQ